ncbi:MAG: tetratricopeptide repeat protein [Elusimicrobiota bacterium]
MSKILKLFRRILICLIPLQIIFPTRLLVGATQKKVISVAMFENVAGNKEYDWLGTGFAETITTKLVNIESLIVVERVYLLEILKEQKLQLSGLTDDKTAVKVGKLLAAQYIVVGSFQEIAGNLKIVARVVSVETAQVESSVTVEGEFNALFELQQQLALELARLIETPVSDAAKLAIIKPPAKNLPAYEWFAKGKMYHYEKFLLDEAVRCYKKAIKIDRDYADAYLELGNVLQTKTFYTKALESYKNALLLYEIKNDKRNLWRVFQNIGVVYYYSGDYQKALEYYNNALEIGEQLGNQPGIANTHNNIGLIYYNLGNYKKALECYNKALEINKKYENKKAIAETYINISAVYDSLGDYDNAFEYCNKAFEISEKLADRHGIAAAYNLFGNIYFSQQDNNKSLEYFKKALELNEELGLKLKIVDSYINIGVVYYSIKKFDNALEYFEKAFQLAMQLNNKLNIARVYNNIGLVYFARYNYDKALKYYNKSLDVKLQLGDMAGAGVVMYNISLIYEYKNDYNTAVKYMEKAVGAFEKINYYMLEKSTNELGRLRRLTF